MSLLSPDAVRFIGSAAPRHGSEVHAAEGPPIDRGYVTRLAQVHERGGFERNPVAFHATASDALLLASGNRDPAAYRDPERFNPDRPDNRHLGFGGSLHYCVGAPLARFEAEAALVALAQRLKNPRLMRDPPPYRPGAALRGPKTLRIAIDGIA